MARILVIDDDEQIRIMFRNMLERDGYEVICASNGKEGIRLYRENPADLIITDLIMPEKDGMEIIMELKRDFPEVKLIAVSGGGHIKPDEYLSIANLLGAQCSFTKPFERDEILKAVKELMG